MSASDAVDGSTVCIAMCDFEIAAGLPFMAISGRSSDSEMTTAFSPLADIHRGDHAWPTGSFSDSPEAASFVRAPHARYPNTPYISGG